MDKDFDSEEEYGQEGDEAENSSDYEMDDGHISEKEDNVSDGSVLS